MRLLDIQNVPVELIKSAKSVAVLTDTEILGYLEDTPFYGVHVQFLEGCAVAVFKYDDSTNTYVIVPNRERLDGLSASYTETFHSVEKGHI